MGGSFIRVGNINRLNFLSPVRICNALLKCYYVTSIGRFALGWKSSPR